jgi:hypothetical protein
MRSLSPDENQLQASIVTALRVRYRDAIVAALPNGGLRGKIEAARMKKTGTLAGMPDLVVILPGGITAWLEVKTATGRLSEAQTEIHYRLAGLGHAVELVRSIEDATAAVNRALARVIP